MERIAVHVYDIIDHTKLLSLILFATGISKITITMFVRTMFRKCR